MCDSDVRREQHDGQAKKIGIDPLDRHKSMHDSPLLPTHTRHRRDLREPGCELLAVHLIQR